MDFKNYRQFDISAISISEPPHIRNWFPDYISDISDCSVSIASDGEDVSLCQVRNFEEDTFADGENNLEEAPIIATSRDAARPTVSENMGKMEFENYSHSIVEDTEEREPMTKVLSSSDMEVSFFIDKSSSSRYGIPQQSSGNHTSTKQLTD